MPRKTIRSDEVIRGELDGVCVEIAEIELYLEGSLQKRHASYRKKDGTLSKHKATPALQYPTANGQGRMRIPWAHVPFVEQLLREGVRRRKLLSRHRDLARELAQALMRKDDGAQKKTSPSPSRRILPRVSAS
jgi:hypothetical protein